MWLRLAEKLETFGLTRARQNSTGGAVPFLSAQPHRLVATWGVGPQPRR